MVQGIQRQQRRRLRRCPPLVTDRGIRCAIPSPAAKQLLTLAVDPLGIVYSGRSSDLAANFTVSVLFGVKVVQRTDARHQRMGHVAKHGHETGVPKEEDRKSTRS